MEVTPQQLETIYNAAYSMMSAGGVRGLVMDSLASKIGMSKRTLYEIFESKQQLIISMFDYYGEKQLGTYEAIVNDSANIMEALLRILEEHTRRIFSLGLNFFKDLDSIYPEVRNHYHEKSEVRLSAIEKMMERGVQEGVFREAINIPIMAKVFEIQIEALKRMELFFPKSYTPEQIYTTVTTSFLRSIASYKGMEILDEYEKERQ